MRVIHAGLAFLCSFAAVRSGDPDWKQNGAFGFPQKEASVLCDTPDLRVSAWNDKEHLFVQAIVFGDGDETLGETEDGRKIGDQSELIVDADADGKATPEVDRVYTLNPWAAMPGLHYQVVLSEDASTGLTGDSKGRGAISYVPGEGGARVRIDSFLIPLPEIGRRPGEELRIAYWASSVKPALTLNSVGHRAESKYHGYDLPLAAYHKITLADRASSLDVRGVPEGRRAPDAPGEPEGRVASEAQAKKPTVALGVAPPEIAAAEWINWKGTAAPTLQSLKGKVVVVEFWATWCGPCVAGIPHLNEIYEKYADKGLVILSLTDQPRKVVDAFMEKKPMKYTVGTGSGTRSLYNVMGIPQAFVVDRDSKLAWQGHPQDRAFEAKLKELLEKK